MTIVAGLGAGECLVGAPLPLNSSLSGRAIAERRPFICNDTNVPTRTRRRASPPNVERALIAPLFSSSGPIGALSVINRERPFSEDDAVVLERLADQVAVAVTNARLYEDAQAVAERYRQAVEDERRAREAVAQSEARYSNLFETATDAIYTLDPQGAFTSVNEATCGCSAATAPSCRREARCRSSSSGDTGMVKEQFKAALLGAGETIRVPVRSAGRSRRGSRR